MKPCLTASPLLAAIAVIGLVAGSANAATIFGTSITGVNTQDTDTDGSGTADSLDATGITWDTVTGIATPSTTLSFTGATSFLLASGDNATSASYINPNVNIGTGGTWATTIDFTLNASTEIDLTQFELNWVATNNSGTAQTQTRPATWTVDIIGSTSGSLGPVVVNSTGATSLAVNNVIFNLSSLPTLDTSETYTLSLTVVENNTSGFFARLEDFNLQGNVTVVPETSTALLGGLGALLLLRRRRG